MSEAALSMQGVPQWDIHDRMRKARETAGLSQSEIASRCGIGRTTIITLETGRKRPTRPQLLAWAMATAVPYEWMCHGDTQACGPRAVPVLPAAESGLRRTGPEVFSMQSKISCLAS